MINASTQEVTIIQDRGHPKMVLMPYDMFEKMQAALEDYEDVAESETILKNNPEFFPLEFLQKLDDHPDQKIKLWRGYRQMSATSLAKTTGISEAYLSQIEHGHRKGSVTTLKKIAAALNLDLDDIL